MITAFEQSVAQRCDCTCFTFVDNKGEQRSYTYLQTRLIAAALVKVLEEKGVSTRSFLAVDLPNCPAFIFLLLAAGLGDFTLVALNNRQTKTEKALRVSSLKRYAKATRTRFAAQASVKTPLFCVDATNVFSLLDQANALVRQSFRTCIHIAERRAHLFDEGSQAVIMFTSGSTGTAKAVPLTWKNLCGSARVSNQSLSRPRQGVWQIALPLYHVGGLQMVVRSILNGTSFVLYQHFDPKRILQDVNALRATHISVVDKMLQDLLESPHAAALTQYRCVLLGGAAPNTQTLRRCIDRDMRLYVSYGMTETASQIANARVDAQFKGGLQLLSGYHARIIDPQSDGFGRLAVKGPGVFGGYLNAQTAHTIDGYFLTGDTAAMRQGLLYLKERTSDMFVSGGENVYPSEIRTALLSQPGVGEAHVFGVPDERWGRRPVAFVERVKHAPGTQLNAHQFAAQLKGRLTSQIAKMYVPKNICVVDALPRIGIGKIDHEALQNLFENRIEIKSVALHRVKLPFKKPFKTPQATLYKRETIVVEVTDHAGRIGLGECVAFASDWYLPETLQEDVKILRDILAPAVLHSTFLHPREISDLFACTDAADYPLACGAIEPALWDLYAKIVKKPLWALLQEENARLEQEDTSRKTGIHTSPSSFKQVRWWERATDVAATAVRVNAGAVVGCGSLQETIAAAEASAQAGYKRVKLKVTPSTCHHIHAVREKLPVLMLSADANQTFATSDLPALKSLDADHLAWIEEPLVQTVHAKHHAEKKYDELERVQTELKTPLCLDESIVTEGDVRQALKHDGLGCYVLKIAKWGGVMPALRFLKEARQNNKAVWLGGMYDTGVSKRLHAAFQTLPGITAPGDIGSTSRYFSHDITSPPYEAVRGSILLNGTDAPFGLGCTLNKEVLNKVCEGTFTIE